VQGRIAFIVAATATPLLAVGYWIGTQQQGDALGGLQRRLAIAELRLARLEHGRPDRASPASAIGPGFGPAVTATSPLQRVLDDPGTAELSRLARERRAALESAFHDQPVDAAWAPATESRLLRAASAPELGLVQVPPTQVQAQCRRSACRVQARFDDASELETWLQGYLLVAVDAVARTEAVQERDASGAMVLTIYGARR